MKRWRTVSHVCMDSGTIRYRGGSSASAAKSIQGLTFQPLSSLHHWWKWNKCMINYSVVLSKWLPRFPPVDMVSCMALSHAQYSEIALSITWNIRTGQEIGIHVHLVQSSQEKRLDTKTFSMQTRPSIRRCTPLKMNKDNILWWTVKVKETQRKKVKKFWRKEKKGVLNMIKMMMIWYYRYE